MSTSAPGKFARATSGGDDGQGVAVVPPWQLVPRTAADAEALTSRERCGTDPAAAYWASLQVIAHVLSGPQDPDPATGRPRPASYLEVLREVRDLVARGPRPVPHDWLLVVRTLIQDAAEEILGQPRQRLRRVHARLPIGKAKQMDARCMSWLARRAGRTLRERVGDGQRVLAVTRPATCDTPENRVVRRTLDEAARVLKTRLQVLHHYDGGHEDGTVPLLERLYATCTTGLARSPLAELQPDDRPRPNNVLLGDPAYARVWRGFQWLRERDHRLAAAWRSGPRDLVRAAQATLLALLAQRPGCHVIERVVRAPCGLEGAAEDRATVLALATPPRLLTCHAATHGIEIDVQELAGAVVLNGRKSEQVQVRIEFRPQEPLATGRGLPVRAEFHGAVNAQPSARLFFGDASGLSELATWVANALLGTARPAAGVTRALVAPAKAAAAAPAPAAGHWTLAGLDLSAPLGRLHAHPAVPVTSERVPLVATQWSVPGHGDYWQAGARASASDPWDPRLRRHDLAVMTGATADRAAESSGDAARQQILAAALEPLGEVRPRAQLALAVPDGATELDLAEVRRALPSAHSTVWTVWRSVAAALAWRDQPTWADLGVRPGDVLLVLNAGAPAVTVTCLVGRCDDTVGPDDSGAYPDAWCWERPAQGAPSPRAPAGYWSFVEKEIEARLKATGPPAAMQGVDVSSVARRAVRDGLLHAALQSEPPQPVYMPLPPAGSDEARETRWLCLPVERTVLRAAADRLLGELAAWFEQWCAAAAGQAVLTHARGGAALHVLLCGEAFEEASAGAAAAARDAIRSGLGPRARDDTAATVRMHDLDDRATFASRGAVVFLRRHRDGLPTWRDVLPRLSLEVATSTGTRLVRLLDGSERVTPGQLIERECGRLQLPAGFADGYRLPLVRDDVARERLAHVARLRHKNFPLRAPLTVNLRVAYRYAEDSFRLIVTSDDPEFGRVEVAWSPATDERSTAAPAIRVPNEPPEFPRPSVWDAEGVAGCAAQLDGELARLYEKAAVIFTRESALLLRGRGNPARAELVARGLRELRESLRTLDRTCARIWPPSRVQERAPEVLATVVHGRLIPFVAALADCRPAPALARKRQAKGEWTLMPLPEQFLTTESPAVVALMRELRTLSLRVLSRLRVDLPRGLFAHLVGAAGGAAGGELHRAVHCVGRAVVTASDEPGRRALDWLLSLALAPGPRVESLRDPLWALGTAAWSYREFVKELSEQDVAALLGQLQRVFERASAAPAAEQPRLVEVYREACFVLLALLRRRPDDGGLAAGTANSNRLADLVEEADACLAAADGSKRPLRLRLAGGSDGSVAAAAAAGRSVLADTCAAALRGERTARVQCLEGEDE